MGSSYRTQLQDDEVPTDEQADLTRRYGVVEILPEYTPSEHDDQTPRANEPAEEQSQPQPQLLSQLQRRSRISQRFHTFSAKAGAPLNKAANLVGAEGWWPSSLDKESTKAARILHSFARIDTPAPPSVNGPKHLLGLTRKSLVKIPHDVLRSCAGLAIFNVLRTGAGHGSLAGGSGVVVARRPDGSWSPPSAVLISTLGAGFNFGLDIYECVCVLNTPAQVEAFTRPRVSLGGHAGLAVGPVGAGAKVESAISRTGHKPAFTYVRSRGLRVGVQVDGTVVLARSGANAAFYGQDGITARQILTGDLAWPEGAKDLFQVLHEISKQTGGTNFQVRETPTPAPLETAPAGDQPVVEKEDIVEVARVEFESAEDEKKRLAASEQ